MRFVFVCFVIFFGCVQALPSDDTSEASEGFNQLQSLDKDSDDIIPADNEESSSSEENSIEKYGPKLDMGETLNTILFSDEASSDKIKHKNNQEIDVLDVNEKTKEIQRVNEELNESSEISKESDPEPGNIIGTYVLWRPYVLDYTSILQAEENYYKSVAFIKDFLQGGIKNEEDEEKENLGWKDDVKQLDLPRVAALNSNNEPDLYDNIADSFNNLKETMNDVVSRPEVKDNMFYILMGLTGFLMLALFNDNIFKKQEPRTVQDHYLLPDNGASANLPTYEECVKADKNILVNIGDNEAFNKVDLSLPVFVVHTEKDGEKRTNKE